MSSRAGSTSAAGGSSDQLRLLVEAQTDYAIFLLDPGGHIISWNPGAQRIKGYLPDEIIGKHFSTFYTAEDIDRDHPAYELETAGRVGRYEEEGWRVRKDGTRFWARVVITALFDETRDLVGFGKVTQDLTERREAEQQLLRSAADLAESERRAREDADRQRARTAGIEEVGRAIVASSSLEDIVQIATDAATQLTKAAFGAFFYNVTDAHGESDILATISGVPREAFSAFPMPRDSAALASSFAGKGIERSDDITADERSQPHHGRPFGHLPVRSYLAVPVRTTDGEVAGGLFFGHPDAGVFDQAAEDAAVSIAASAAVAIVNARLVESLRREADARERALAERDHVARVLQQSLLPPALPAIAGLELGSHYQAGTELVGGDFYDVVALNEGRWGIVLGDVCGIGPEAASQTALTRHSVRTAAMFDADPASVLRALNTALLRSGTDRFTTAVFACVAPRDDGTFTIALASGGHPPPILCRADGTIELSQASGPLLGIAPDPELEIDRLTAHPGDTLVLYTDGLVEARRGGELFGVERLAQTIAAAREHPAAELAAAAVERAQEFAGAPVTDDIAVVVVRVV